MGDYMYLLWPQPNIDCPTATPGGGTVKQNIKKIQGSIFYHFSNARHSSSSKATDLIPFPLHSLGHGKDFSFFVDLLMSIVGISIEVRSKDPETPVFTTFDFSLKWV